MKKCEPTHALATFIRERRRPATRILHPAMFAGGLATFRVSHDGNGKGDFV